MLEVQEVGARKRGLPGAGQLILGIESYAVEGISATGKYGELCLVTDGRVLEPWILDSGASCHMTFSLEGMTNFKPCSRPMAGATGEKHRIEGYGKLSLEFVDESGNEAMVTLNRAAYVPALKHNLFSLMTVHKSGFSFATTPTGVSIFDGKPHLKSSGDLLMAHAARCFPVPVYLPSWCCCCSHPWPYSCYSD
ncbi:unnamed protein product [Discosporangium mesarthrocarpum]